jgi:hypothetical protein
MKTDWILKLFFLILEIVALILIGIWYGYKPCIISALLVGVFNNLLANIVKIMRSMGIEK